MEERRGGEMKTTRVTLKYALAFSVFVAEITSIRLIHSNRVHFNYLYDYAKKKIFINISVHTSIHEQRTMTTIIAFHFILSDHEIWCQMRRKIMCFNKIINCFLLTFFFCFRFK